MPNDSPRLLRRLRITVLPLALAACATGSEAQVASATAATVPQLTYADIAGLAEAASVIVRVRVKDQATVEPDRARGVAPGLARLYVEAETEAVLKAPAALGESLTYLADVPLDAKGRAPKLKKQSFLVFARPVPGGPGQLQLVQPDAQIGADGSVDARLRAIIAELASPDAPPRISGVRDAMSVPGNLAGESETQVFLETVHGTPVSLTVLRRPGQDPTWGVSWTELVDQSAEAPQRGTLEWYRLACFLPRELPQDAYLQREQAARYQAQADYGYILAQLGECERTRS
ncbi:MAG: hypothetical protein ACO1OD_00360 [Croceibacterium sp.]